MLSGSQHSKLKLRVAWLNGNLPYGGTIHLRYMIPAIFFLIFVSITAVGLLLYPLMIDIRQCNLSDSLNRPFGPSVASFYEGYKRNCRFYAGVLFIYRIVIVLVFSFTIEADSIFCITLVSLALIIITAIAQPYEKDTDNSIAILCISNIIFINLLSFNNLHYTVTQSNRNLQPCLWIQLVFVLLPLFYTAYFLIKKLLPLFYTAYFLIKKVWRKLSLQPFWNLCNQRRDGTLQNEDDPSEESCLINKSTRSVRSFESDEHIHNTLHT